MARRWQLCWTRRALRSLTSPILWTLPPWRRGAASLGPFLTLRSSAKCRSWPQLWRATATWHTWIWKSAGWKWKASRSGAWRGDPGFRCGSAKSLHKTLQARRILPTFLIHSTYSFAVARCLLDSGWHLQSKNYIENMLDSKISKGVAGILALDDLRWVW